MAIEREHPNVSLPPLIKFWPLLSPISCKGLVSAPHLVIQYKIYSIFPTPFPLLYQRPD